LRIQNNTSLFSVVATIVLTLLFNLNAYAHTLSTSYITISFDNRSLKDDGLTVTFELTLFDLYQHIQLDSNQDQNITWGEVLQQKRSLEALLNQEVFFEVKSRNSATTCSFIIDDLLLNKLTDDTYLIIKTHCSQKVTSESFSLRYNLFFDTDPTHKAIVTVKNSGTSQAFIINDKNRTIAFSSSHHVHNIWKNSLIFFNDGIEHILFGLDHILFLLTLLLPSVLILENKERKPCPNFKTALIEVLKIVTVFTCAHTITLLLSAFSIITPSPRIIEPIIATSIIAGSAACIFTSLFSKRLLIAFLFGLFHGFGFASGVFEHLSVTFATAIKVFLFNAGVEAGQILFIFALFPLLYILRVTRYYRDYILPFGCLVISGIALYWVIERIQ
jgi:hydrogenase/urease accessory protein HupE